MTEERISARVRQLLGDPIVQGWTPWETAMYEVQCRVLALTEILVDSWQADKIDRMQRLLERVVHHGPVIPVQLAADIYAELGQEPPHDG